MQAIKVESMKKMLPHPGLTWKPIHKPKMIGTILDLQL